jgi:hypothetical protein
MTNTVVVVCFHVNTFRPGPVFFDIDIETILIVESSDNLNISSELDVFKASMRWISGNVMHRNVASTFQADEMCSISFHDTG